LPPLLLAGVLTRLEGVLKTEDEAATAVDGAFAVPLLYDPPGVLCSCCVRVLLFDC